MSTQGGGGGTFGHSSTPVSPADVVRVVSRALSERTFRLHLTAGQRWAILHRPLGPGPTRA